MIESTFTAWRERLLRFCTHLLRHRHDAEEVVQDVFAALVAAGNRYDLAHEPGVLLFQLARNRCIDLRRKRTADVTDTLDPPARDERPRLELQEALVSLPYAQREVVLLTAVDGLGYREVAAILGCSLGTVAGERAAALSTLRRRLAP
ncbi:MAG: sigma-70 family RNA polymerase sigma factor [Planctomycetes bacterium]|nr:sigma-70 family RNA polymerase sigma factor [Planctomycetota bacterium]